MRSSITLGIFFLVIAEPSYLAQSGSVTVLEAGWKYIRESGKKEIPQTGVPAPAMITENRNFQRNARENQMQQRGAIDPNEHTVDGRSAQLEKLAQEARAIKSDDKAGFIYFANIKNDSDKHVDIIFWEFRFTELANPSNVVRRQFLCGASIKAGDKRDLSAFSILGPSDVISADSLAQATGKTFDEKAFINRIEYSDGTVLQRRDWKYDDYKQSIKRATSIPWGKEVCRML